MKKLTIMLVFVLLALMLQACGPMTDSPSDSGQATQAAPMTETQALVETEEAARDTATEAPATATQQAAPPTELPFLNPEQYPALVIDRCGGSQGQVINVPDMNAQLRCPDDVNAFQAAHATDTPTAIPSFTPTHTPDAARATAEANFQITATSIVQTATAQASAPRFTIRYVGFTPEGQEPVLVVANETSWELPLLAFYSSFIDPVTGRHMALEPAPSSAELGWCRATTSLNNVGQQDCINRVGLWQIGVPSDRTDVSVQMEVGTRIVIANYGEEVDVIVAWRSYSDSLRDDIADFTNITTYEEDYEAAISTSDNPSPSDETHLALTFMSREEDDVASTLNFNGANYLLGSGCWDCAGRNVLDESADIVALNLTDYIGPQVQEGSTGANANPAYSIIIPRPEENSEVVIRTALRIPANTSVVVLLGQMEITSGD